MNCLLGRWFTWNVGLFSLKNKKEIFFKVSSAVVVISALRVNGKVQILILETNWKCTFHRYEIHFFFISLWQQMRCTMRKDLFWANTNSKDQDQPTRPSNLGPVVQSIVGLTSSLVVKTLTVLVNTISKSQIFCWKNVSSFCKCKSYSHFSAKILVYMPYLMIKVLTIRKF